jgi:hypothetical protein
MGGFVTESASIRKHLALHICGIICETVRNIETVDKPGFFQFCCDYVSRDGGIEHITGVQRLQAIFRTVMIDQDPETGLRLDPHLYPEKIHRLAFGFLGALAHTDVRFVESPEPLGLESGENFWRSYFKRFYGALGLPAASLWNLSKEAQNKATVMPVFRQLLRMLPMHLFHTANGYLGFGPSKVLPGDLVCVLNECGIPLLLRRVESHYILVGQCFVLGLMDGEGSQRVKNGKADIQGFEIR